MNFKDYPQSKLNVQKSLLETPRCGVARSRNNTMLLKTGVELAGEDRLKCPFVISATATNLNFNGGIIQLARDLTVGSVLMVKNRGGARVSARITACLTSQNGMFAYEIEFVQPDETTNNFWGITFPPNA